MITTQTYVIITMILLGALWVALVFLLRPNCSLKGCKKGRSLTVNSRLKAPEDIIPIRNCSLFSALYVDWGDVPSFWSRSLYQPKNVSFLFRAPWIWRTTSRWCTRSVPPGPSTPLVPNSSIIWCPTFGESTTRRTLWPTYPHPLLVRTLGFPIPS
jgi:hypothetical protein